MSLNFDGMKPHLPYKLVPLYTGRIAAFVLGTEVPLHQNMGFKRLIPVQVTPENAVNLLVGGHPKLLQIRGGDAQTVRRDRLNACHQRLLLGLWQRTAEIAARGINLSLPQMYEGSVIADIPVQCPESGQVLGEIVGGDHHSLLTLRQIIKHNHTYARLDVAHPQFGKHGIIANSLREVLSVAGKSENRRVFLKFESFNEEEKED